MSSIELKNHVVTNEMHCEVDCDAEHGKTGEPIMTQATASDPTIQNLMQYCASNSTTYMFLSATANYLPVNGNWRSADEWYYGLTRFVIIATIFLNLFGIIFSLLVPSILSATVRYATVGMNAVAIIRTISVAIVQYLNQYRMQKPVHAYEILVVEDCAKIAGIYGIVVFITNVVSTILFTFSSVPNNAAFEASEYFLGTYLSFNLFFLILDVKASSVLLDQLHLLADSKSLTMDVFVSSRSDIHRRVKESRWASDLVVVPCVASVVAILVLIIYFLNVPDQTAWKIDAAAFVFILLKELLFVVVAFWYVAKVNARADELTVKLSRSLWGTESVSTFDIENSGVLVDSNGCLLSNRKISAQSSNSDQNESIHVSDIHRLSIHASSVSEPISFTLLFKRVNWKNVVVSSGGFVVAILIAVIKNGVEQSIEN